MPDLNFRDTSVPRSFTLNRDEWILDPHAIDHLPVLDGGGCGRAALQAWPMLRNAATDHALQLDGAVPESLVGHDVLVMGTVGTEALHRA